MVHGLFRASGIVMIYRCHHAQARRRQVRMPGSLLESTGGSIFPSAEALAGVRGKLTDNVRWRSRCPGRGWLWGLTRPFPRYKTTMWRWRVLEESSRTTFAGAHVVQGEGGYGV